MRYLLSVLALLALNAPALHAQDGGISFTGTIFGGSYVPSKSLSDGSKFTNGTLYGGGVTLWAGTKVGFRASVLWTRSEVNAVSLSSLENQDPAIILVSTDAILRPSFDLLGFNPYVFGGVGLRHYALTKFLKADGYSAFAASGGAGLEKQLTPRLGLLGEARHVFGGFKKYEYDETQRDWTFAGGLVIRF